MEALWFSLIDLFAAVIRGFDFAIQNWSLWLPSVAAVAAAFFGAHAAFRLERKERHKELLASQVSAIRKAQLVLAAYTNSVTEFRQQYLDPLEKTPNRETILKHGFVSPAHLTLNLDSLSFVADKKRPQVFMDLYLAHRTYFNFVDALEQRNKCLDKMFDTGDPKLLPMLKDLTDALYKGSDFALSRFKSVDEILRETMKELFPGNFPLKFSMKQS